MENNENDKYGRKKIDGKTYRKIYHKTKTTGYKIKIHGITYFERCDTPKQAMELAEKYFALDHSIHHAEIVEYTENPVGLVLYNKNYEKTLV